MSSWKVIKYIGHNGTKEAFVRSSKADWQEIRKLDERIFTKEQVELL